MDKYLIRPALPDDLPHMAGIERAAASMFPPGAIPDAIRSDSVLLPALAAALERGDLWVAEYAGIAVVGFAFLLKVEGTALLAEMDVVPEHGRRGLGRRLVSAAADRARQTGYDALYLTTFSHVPWNMPFYARLGFCVLNEKETPSVMKGILEAEQKRGLRQRVAMRLVLP